MKLRYLLLVTFLSGNIFSMQLTNKAELIEKLKKASSSCTRLMSDYKVPFLIGGATATLIAGGLLYRNIFQNNNNNDNNFYPESIKQQFRKNVSENCIAMARNASNRIFIQSTSFLTLENDKYTCQITMRTCINELEMTLTDGIVTYPTFNGSKATLRYGDGTEEMITTVNQ